MEKIGLNESIPLRSWILRGFAGVLHESALEKVWDKVIGGSMVNFVHRLWFVWKGLTSVHICSLSVGYPGLCCCSIGGDFKNVPAWLSNCE